MHTAGEDFPTLKIFPPHLEMIKQNNYFHIAISLFYEKGTK